MDCADDYNVVGSLLGLGEYIFLEIISGMTLPQDVRQFLVVCKKFNKLKDHPRFAKIIQSIIQIPPGFIIKEAWQGISDRMKFIHSNQLDCCAIAIDPIIKEGIVRIEIVFENTRDWLRIIGIVDTSFSFAAGDGPLINDRNGEKTVRYWGDGNFCHVFQNAEINGRYKDGQRISAIVDMTSNPRKVVFYVDDIEQPNYVIGIPSEIRFWAYTLIESSSFTVTKFERLVQFTSQRIAGSKALQWGKQWE
ncbi:MAG: hypothetical protein EZS28_001941 [Streblomastix strix]|uniref:B30.2/SPRY domain-containing protein n=1 Tax=Streblomastix strix TaxID=222440 RepID=A0A5J4X684_9EUKA|nr:MAG: hypothetical protein EZS28_001941 [Streblomastix strix]